MAQHRREKTKIVILGGGVGGLSAALRLDRLTSDRDDIDITLIDQQRDHLLTYRLNEFAARRISYPRIAIPIELVLEETAVRFIQSRVESIDAKSRTLKTTTGEMEYDYLIASPGGVTNFYGIPGLEKHGIGLKTLEDARRIREHVLDMFTRASKEREPELRLEMLTFVIGGGGFTGVEMAAALAEWVNELADETGINRAEARIVIVESNEQLVGFQKRELSNVLRRFLVSKGVDIVLGKAIASVRGDSVQLSDGTAIKTHTVIWSGGARANPIIENLDISKDTSGRALVMTNLVSETSDSIYIIGDAACCINPNTNLPAPDLAQIAGKEGICAAENIYADIEGTAKRSCKLDILGIVINLGTADAVAIVKGRIVTGIAAKAIEYFRHFKFLYSLGGISFINRYFDWVKKKEREIKTSESRAA